MENEIAVTIDKESKNQALLIWLLSIFFGFLPGLIFYILKKDDAYVQDQAKEALNWFITSLIAYVISIILTFILIGFLMLVALGIAHLVFCIMGIMAVSDGKNFRVPFAIRLIK